MRRQVLAVLCVLGVGVVGSAWLAAQGQSAPLRQTAYLKASNPGMFDHFGEGGSLDGHIGQGIAISGDGTTLVVGAQHESSNARGINGNQNNDDAYNAGAAYVFVRNGANWTQQAYVKASNAGSGDHFGNAVAISADGNTIAVSAYFESGGATGVNGNQNDDSIPQSGAVYVFTRNGSTWTQQAYVKASNTGTAGMGDVPGDGDQFGFSLAASTATRRTTRRARRAPSTSTRAPAPRGRSRPTSSRMLRRWRPAGISSAIRSR
jgi:hypothetical protein